MIEYNCRFGDPETQVVLALLKSDLFTIMRATTDGTLRPDMVRFSDKAAACVIMASDGYPLHYEKGYAITMTDAVKPHVLVAGAKQQDGKLVTSGGRVLGVVAVEDTLKAALDTAYARVNEVHFDNAFYRKDIGKRALEA